MKRGAEAGEQIWQAMLLPTNHGDDHHEDDDEEHNNNTSGVEVGWLVS